MGIIALCLIVLIKISPLKKDFCFSSVLASEANLFLGQKEQAETNSVAVMTINDDSFKANGPIGLYETRTTASLGEETGQRQEIIRYVVQEGETISLISQKFGLSLTTVLEANNLTSRSLISPGKELIIPQTDGPIHLVQKGESVGYLAGVYKAKTAEIILFNGLSDEGEIFAGDLLVIPNGKKPVQSVVISTPLASSYFICPIPAPCRRTQGLHWYNAIDFANNGCGETVFAAAGGQIQNTGFTNIGGNYVRILHPNSVVTYYGHLSKILVVPGQKVSQGEIIGYTGNTGYTIGVTGCHLHFEVRGAVNPFAY